MNAWEFSTDRHTDKFVRICFTMKSLATILAVLVVQIVHAVEEEGDINIIIEQNVVPPDVDECLEKIDACADNEIYENMPGTYRCVCADGFEKVKGICKDIDECIEKCGIHGVCINSPGSFTCTCNEGFEEVEGICEDIDECIEMCGIHRVCVNSPGSFTCTCNEGFEEVEGICEDIDECKDNTTNSCGDNENEMCANTIGNYTCRCIEGYYIMDGFCTECKSPSLELDDFGCILPFHTLFKEPWAEASDDCQSSGGKLIEGIKHEHLEPIINAFINTEMNGKNPWVGMKDSRWVISQIDVAKDDEVWIDGEPSLENDVCGTINMDANNPGLADTPCTDLTNHFFCQFLP